MFSLGVCVFSSLSSFSNQKAGSRYARLVGWRPFSSLRRTDDSKNQGHPIKFHVSFLQRESTTNNVRPYISRNLPVLPPSQRQIRGGYENFCFVPWTTKKTRGLDNLLSCTLQYLHLRESKQSPGAACHSCRPNAPSSNKHPKKKKATHQASDFLPERRVAFFWGVLSLSHLSSNNATKLALEITKQIDRDQDHVERRKND